MQVLLVSTNIEKSYPYPVPPLGAGYVCNYLKQNGHSVKLIDICFEKNWKSLLQSEIEIKNADLILLSIRNIDNCLFPNTIEYISHNREIVETLCELTPVPMVAGGIAVRMMGAEFLRAINVDWGYRGRASQSMIKGLEVMAKGGDMSGYAFFINSKDETNEVKYHESNLDFYDLNAEIYDHINIEAYTQNGGGVGFQTKYGCNAQCIYCTYPVIEGKKIICFDPQIVVDTIEHVTKKYQLRFFEFADSTFNNPPEHAKEICRLLAKKNLNVGWSAFVSPQGCDEEFLYLCKLSGCAGLDLGIDSGSERILHNLKKGFTTDDIISSAKAALKSDLPVCFNLVLGGPGEDEETLTETFTLLDKYNACAVSAYSALRVYPGTELEKIARSEGKVEGSLAFPQFYISDNIVHSLNSILKKHQETNPEWMLRGIVRPPSAELIARFGKNRNSPLWVEKNNGFLSRRKR